MSLTGEHLKELCDRKGTDDGSAGAAFSSPVNDSEQEAYDAYSYAYWVAMSVAQAPPQIEPNKRIVRRARMVVLNKRLAMARRSLSQ